MKKALMVLAALPLLIGFTASGLMAQESWFIGLDDYTVGVPSQQQKQATTGILNESSGAGVFRTGMIRDYNLTENSMVVNTQVPGLFGPEQRDIPFQLMDDSTMTICVKGTNECYGAFSGVEALRVLANFDSMEKYAAADKEALIVEDPVTNRIVHVQVNYR